MKVKIDDLSDYIPKEKVAMHKLKYTIEEFIGENAEKKFRVALLNELHNIYSALWEMKERKKATE